MTKLYVSAKKNTDFANCNIVLNSNAIDTKTKKIRRISDEIIPIFSQASDAGYYFLLIARIPSKLPQGPGYCGAGYEDHMILLEYNRKRIRLLDDFLLQSCLTAISLAGDKSDNFLESISVDRKNHLVNFRWLGNPDDDDHVLKISEGKLLIN